MFFISCLITIFVVGNTLIVSNYAAGIPTITVLLMLGFSESLMHEMVVGVFEYGGPMIKFYDSNNKLILKYGCNAYECPLNDNVNFFRVSEGVIPRFSLFGCYETYGAGTSCIPTIISNSLKIFNI